MENVNQGKDVQIGPSDSSKTGLYQGGGRKGEKSACVKQDSEKRKFTCRKDLGVLYQIHGARRGGEARG